MRYKQYIYKCECGDRTKICLWDNDVTPTRKCKCGKMADVDVTPTSRPIKSYGHEMVFDRPNPSKDIPETLKRMEASGGLKTPSAIAAAKVKIASVKGRDYGKVDYQKEGQHPLA